MKRFGDVPWIDVELGSADEALWNPRDNREVVMQHMLATMNKMSSTSTGTIEEQLGAMLRIE